LVTGTKTVGSSNVAPQFSRLIPDTGHSVYAAMET
jgi:hypothetical protein